MKKATTTSDEELIVAYKNGDNKAFDFFYKKYKNLAIHHSRKIVFDYELARDLTQEAFYKFIVCINSKTFPKENNFKSLLITIVINLSIDYLRRRKGQVFLVLDSVGNNSESNFEKKNDLLNFLHSNEDTVLEKIIQDEEKKHLWNAIDRLPRNERYVLRQKYYFGMKFDEIALLNGCPCVTWRGRSRRGIKKLRNYFQGIEKKQD